MKIRATSVTLTPGSNSKLIQILSKLFYYKVMHKKIVFKGVLNFTSK